MRLLRVYPNIKDIKSTQLLALPMKGLHHVLGIYESPSPFGFSIMGLELLVDETDESMREAQLLVVFNAPMTEQPPSILDASFPERQAPYEAYAKEGVAVPGDIQDYRYLGSVGQHTLFLRVLPTEVSPVRLRSVPPLDG